MNLFFCTLIGASETQIQGTKCENPRLKRDFHTVQRKTRGKVGASINMLDPSIPLSVGFVLLGKTNHCWNQFEPKNEQASFADQTYDDIEVMITTVTHGDLGSIVEVVCGQRSSSNRPVDI